MKRIAIFCGSSIGIRPEYSQAAEAMALALHEQNIDLVYGGSIDGLMGVIAQKMLSLGRQVIGVLPRNISKREIADESISELIYVDSFAERKAKIMALSDAFIAMPGGIGTLDELFELFTAAQFHYHHGPCALFNVAGYYDHLINFIQHSEKQGFVSVEQAKILLIDSDPQNLLKKCLVYRAPRARKV